jgi:hypothetical protein
MSLMAVLRHSRRRHRVNPAQPGRIARLAAAERPINSRSGSISVTVHLRKALRGPRENDSSPIGEHEAGNRPWGISSIEVGA